MTAVIVDHQDGEPLTPLIYNAGLAPARSSATAGRRRDEPYSPA
jgi:hypothetical protein